MEFWISRTRGYTFGALTRAVRQAGFDVVEAVGVPAPFHLALGENRLSRSLVALNRLLIRLSRGLFSWQILLRARPRPSLEALLQTARERSQVKAEALEGRGSDHREP